MRLMVCPSWARQLKSWAGAGEVTSAPTASAAPAMKLRRVMACPPSFWLWRSGREVAAVDRDRDAIDKARGRRGEEHRRAGELVGLRPALGRQPRHDLRVESFFLTTAAADLGVDPAWRDGVHADAVLGESH